MLHPQQDNHGNTVVLKHPSQPTQLETWDEADQLAVVVPGGQMPRLLNLRAVTSQVAGDWESMAAACRFDEPEFAPPNHLKPAAGVVIIEEDGRIWLCAPSNGFAGYTQTCPKGQADGRSLRVTALKEAYEETGLIVQLIDFLVDVPRSTTYTRYYVARRLAGNPADMGWESQAVLLAPVRQLPDLLIHPNDQRLREAIEYYWANAKPSFRVAGRLESNQEGESTVDNETSHWSSNSYWTDALGRYYALRDSGQHVYSLT